VAKAARWVVLSCRRGVGWRGLRGWQVGSWGEGHGSAGGWFYLSKASPSSRGIAYAFAHICDINKPSQVCGLTRGVRWISMGGGGGVLGDGWSEGCTTPQLEWRQIWPVFMSVARRPFSALYRGNDEPGGGFVTEADNTIILLVWRVKLAKTLRIIKEMFRL